MHNLIHLPWEECTGCFACKNVCPVGAITLPEDEDGYIHASINHSKCIECHLCEKTCPVYVKCPKEDPVAIFAAEVIESEERNKSASGGLASLITDCFIKFDRGVVYGCSERNYKTVEHIRISEIEDGPLLRNSKYVQSNIGDIFKSVQEDLRNRLPVLFIGTPCQVAGLLNFLKRPYENLITIDLVCHGVPPMKMLREQIENDPKLKDYISSDLHVEFRWKEFPKDLIRIRFGMRYSIQRGEEKQIVKTENDIVNPYMRCFQTGISLRDSCYDCKYTTKGRVSDITLADFWGLGTDIPSKMDAREGISLLLVNSRKGADILTKIRSRVNLEEHTFEEASMKNRCLTHPFACPPKRSEFLKIFKENGLEKATLKTDPIHAFEKKKLIQLLRRSIGGDLIVKVIFKGLRILKVINL